MRFSYLAVFALSCNPILSSPVLSPRDTTIFEKSIKEIVDTAKDLAAAIQALDRSVKRGGDITHQRNDIESYSQDLTTALKEGTAQITQAPALYTYESIAMYSTVEALSTQTDATVNAWIVAKPSIIKAGGKQTVLQILGVHAQASDEFANAMVAKMPYAAVPFAKRYGTKAKSSIQQAITAFKS